MMLRACVRIVDRCGAANAGGPPMETMHTVDFECPELERMLRADRTKSYLEHTVVGVALVEPSAKEGCE